MARKLDTYHQKRDFGTTPEPSGLDQAAVKPSEHLRFVVQKHDATRLHFDLRLELDGVFKSWAVTRGPSLDPAEKRLAVEVEDHPLEYGDFEGTIPAKEYGGGTVMIWDRGFWAPEMAEAPEASLLKGELKIILAGSRMKGSWVLVRLKGRAKERNTNWLLIKHKDKWATPGVDTIQDADTSIASGRSMAAIAAGKGKQPQRFLTDGPATGAAAVWNAAATERSRQRGAAEKLARGPSTDVAPPKLTNPERLLWPGAGDDAGITKRQLAEYLMAVGPWMIHHLFGRPCSLIRAPDGVGGQTFFQRHAMAGQHGATLARVDDEHEPYLQIDDAQSLVAMAQLSALEYHPWNNAPFQPNVPGRLVFDLDPAEDVPFDRVVEAARALKTRLEPLGLVPFAKTTGGKGMHVVVPLTGDPLSTWAQAKLFTQAVCTQMADAEPKRYLVNMAKKERTGRIYLDFLRNEFGSTAASVLSPRARAGAPISMPLDWPQVKRGLDAGRFTVKTAPALLAKGKPWAGYADSARSLTAAVATLISLPTSK